MPNTCRVEFPQKIRVTAEPGRVIEPKAGQGVVLEDVPEAKARKYAHVADATVFDAEGNKIAGPEVKITDNRAEAAAEVAAGHETEIADLKATVARLEAALEGKADRRGPTPGTKKG